MNTNQLEVNSLCVAPGYGNTLVRIAKIVNEHCIYALAITGPYAGGFIFPAVDDLIFIPE